jgi:hypothetical protein
MKIEDLLENVGVYKVQAKDMPDSVWFVREPYGKEDRKDGDMGPLLHICERDIERGSEPPMVVIMTDVVKWDFFYGHYYCTGCKETWDEKDDAGLRAIWSDGFGTGDEGHV